MSNIYLRGNSYYGKKTDLQKSIFCCYKIGLKVSFWGTTIIQILDFKASCPNLKCVWLFYYFDFERNCDV